MKKVINSKNAKVAKPIAKDTKQSSYEKVSLRDFFYRVTPEEKEANAIKAYWNFYKLHS